jgi:hypothetical protein
MDVSSLAVTIVRLTQEVGFDIVSCWDCSWLPRSPLGLTVAEIVLALALYVLGLQWSDRSGDFLPKISKATWTYAVLVTLILAVELPELDRLLEEPDRSTLIRTLFVTAALIQIVTVVRIVRRRRSGFQKPNSVS